MASSSFVARAVDAVLREMLLSPFDGSAMPLRIPQESAVVMVKTEWRAHVWLHTLSSVSIDSKLFS